MHCLSLAALPFFFFVEALMCEALQNFLGTALQVPGLLRLILTVFELQLNLSFLIPTTFAIRVSFFSLMYPFCGLKKFLNSPIFLKVGQERAALTQQLDGRPATLPEGTALGHSTKLCSLFKHHRETLSSFSVFWS